MEKGFFKVFNSETSAERMKIPTCYTNYKSEKLPKKVLLRNRFGNMYPIRVIKKGRDFYFQYGWEKFIEDNNIECADILIFDYDEKETFDFKLLGINGCEKKEIGGEKKVEEIEHEKSVESKGKTWVSDSCNSSFDDDRDEDHMLEEEDVEEKVEKEEKTHRKVACSKRRYVDKEEDEKEEWKGEKEEAKEDEDEEENERVGSYKKNIQRSEEYVPTDVLRDYKLELPPSMTIRDSIGREFDTRVKKWNDGTIWLVGGWSSLCGWNLVEKDVRCICEFMRGKCGKGLYLQVQVLHEGSISHPNNN